MKSITKALVLLCILVVSVTVATACNGPNCTASTGTTSSNLPSQDEVNSAIMTAKVANSGNFAENFFSSIKTNHSTWHTDLWTSGSQEVVSVYYSVSSGSYGAYYLDETGNQITPTSGLVLKEKYAGDGVGSSTTSGTCTGPNCSQSTGTNSSSVISCPTCGLSAQTAGNDTTGATVSTTTVLMPTNTTTTSDSSVITLSSNNSTVLTTKQQQELDTFMSDFSGTLPQTQERIRERAIACFFNGSE